MTKTQMMCFQAALETKRHELMREIHARAGRLAIREDGCDRIDEVQSMNQRDEAVLAVEWLQRVLSDVDAALRAVSEGVYGACAECGEPVSLKRLETIPWASHCIGCQELLERREAWKRVPLLGRCASMGTGRSRHQAMYQQDAFEQDSQLEEADMPVKATALRSPLGRAAVLVDTVWISTLLNSSKRRWSRRRDGRRNV